MKIKDLNGFEVEITNLDEAIQIAEQYKNYEHLDKGFSELDIQLNIYWTDMYEKLLKIKAKHNEQPLQ